MLNEKEKRFVEFWESRRDRENNIVYQFLTGLPIGLLFSLPIMFLLFSSRWWFKRADMVANSKMSPGVILFALVLISSFVAILYKKRQWETRDQQYRELKARSEDQS